MSDSRWDKPHAERDNNSRLEDHRNELAYTRRRHKDQLAPPAGGTFVTNASPPVPTSTAETAIAQTTVTQKSDTSPSLAPPPKGSFVANASPAVPTSAAETAIAQPTVTQKSYTSPSLAPPAERSFVANATPAILTSTAGTGFANKTVTQRSDASPSLAPPAAPILSSSSTASSSSNTSQKHEPTPSTSSTAAGSLLPTMGRAKGRPVKAPPSEPTTRRTCNYCKDKKARCTGGEPGVRKCSRCERKNRNCVYEMKDKPGPKPGQRKRVASTSCGKGGASSKENSSSNGTSTVTRRLLGGWTPGKRDVQLASANGIYLASSSPSAVQEEGLASASAAAVSSSENNGWNIANCNSSNDSDTSSDELIARADERSSKGSSVASTAPAVPPSAAETAIVQMTMAQRSYTRPSLTPPTAPALDSSSSPLSSSNTLQQHDQTAPSTSWTNARRGSMQAPTPRKRQRFEESSDVISTPRRGASAAAVPLVRSCAKQENRVRSSNRRPCSRANGEVGSSSAKIVCSGIDGSRTRCPVCMLLRIKHNFTTGRSPRPQSNHWSIINNASNAGSAFAVPVKKRKFADTAKDWQ